MIAHSEAHAGVCAPPTPQCHLENGKELLQSDPKRAAEELLASYKLDERTDTLVLYANALQAERQYAGSLETWQRIIVFRESEIEAAKEAARKSTGRKLAAAQAAQARARKQNEEAAEMIMKLWPSVGRVRIKFAPGQQLVVTRGGIEVDTSRAVLVNAGRDELVFTSSDGKVASIVVEVAAGDTAKLDAPNPAAKPATQKLETTTKPETAPDLTVKPKPAAEAPEPSLSTAMFVEEPRSRMMSRIGLGLVAGAVVAGGIAGTFGYLANRDFDNARDAGCSSDGKCQVGNPSIGLAERANDRARVAQISAIGGGALLVTGAALWFVGRGKTRRAATDVTLRVGPSSAAIGWGF